MTDIPFNTYIEWTKEDRARGKCPVPAGSEVTVWFEDGHVVSDRAPDCWIWHECSTNIIAYMVHSIPQQPREFWIDVDGYAHETRREALSTNPAQKPIHVREVLE